jgi:transcriptional regulator with GAF, ATPase, and Fis domain
MNGSHFNSNPPAGLQSNVEAMYQAFMAADRLQNTSQQILDLASRLTGAENCSLMMLNGRGGLYVLNARGQHDLNLRASQIKVGEGIAGQVVVDGNPLLVEDISADARFSALKRERYRTGSFIACPVTTRKEVIGVLNLNDKDSGEPFSIEDLAHAKFISTVVESALHGFLVNSSNKVEKGEIESVLHRLVEAECNSREFVSRISDDLIGPLQHIKDAVQCLKNSSLSDESTTLDQREIIENEVNFLLSYIVEKIHGYERVKTWLNDIEENETYGKLLD